MLARGAGARPALPPAPGPDEGPAAEELAIPADVLAAAPPAELVRLVHKSQEARVTLAERFDDVFEHLVTGGKADEYHGLVERFRARFDALADNVERARARIEVAPAGALMAGMIGRINDQERRRLEMQLELQVLRQRLSISRASGLVKEGEKARVAEVEGAIKACQGAIFEALEELREEAADLDDE
jgi:hypothetical protein